VNDFVGAFANGTVNGMGSISMPFIPAVRKQPCHPIQTIIDGVLNLVYPDSCIICAAPVSRQKDCGVCESCWAKACMLGIQPPFCPLCGIPYQIQDFNDSHLCGRCILETPPYSAARSFGFYAAELSSLIQHLKFHGRKNLVGLLSQLLSWAFCQAWTANDFDLIVPVPLHSRRERERGYNQAALLARCLSHTIGIPHCESLLHRVKQTPSQVGLSDRERFRNLRRAFHCVATGGAKGLRILLIDDVMTTGATVSSACETLRDGGTARVSALTVARAVPGVE
jgi:competence protein ComFC